ncbi:PTS sugar transporter subunit IIA [uncultured Dubosiella sp.]|uniref:PTS sugar transporter subunit IIA n=1 Tax=uncultured Dubosiella sp. TaxID=1937011 RepID=UPI00272F520D|nr:PTS sugar transporter subunit IIA [uncultured Dubosiella sp.]
MIKTLLKPENCLKKEKVSDWRDAIHQALVPLRNGGWCTEEYEQSVLDNTAKFGPYYVLCPDLALIHAGPEKGVNGTQMAVTVLNEPVRFSEEGPDVHVLVALAAIDKEAHMEGIRATANIFMDPDKAQRVIQAPNSNALYELFVANAAEC